MFLFSWHFLRLGSSLWVLKLICFPSFQEACSVNSFPDFSMLILFTKSMYYGFSLYYHSYFSSCLTVCFKVIKIISSKLHLLNSLWEDTVWSCKYTFFIVYSLDFAWIGDSSLSQFFFCFFFNSGPFSTLIGSWYFILNKILLFLFIYLCIINWYWFIPLPSSHKPLNVL